MLCSIQSCPFGRHSMSCSRRDPGDPPGSDGGAQADRTRTAEVRGRTHGGRGTGRNRRNRWPMTSEAGSGTSPAAGTAEGRPGRDRERAGCGRERAPWRPVTGGWTPASMPFAGEQAAVPCRLGGACGARAGMGRGAQGPGGGRGSTGSGHGRGGQEREGVEARATDAGHSLRTRRSRENAYAAGQGLGGPCRCGPGGRGEPDGTGKGRGTGRARAGHRPFRRCPALAPP